MDSKPAQRSFNLTRWAYVDDGGRLVLPPEVVAEYGLQPGAQLRLDPGKNDIRLHRPVTHLAKIYVEPTNCCNLDCRTCIRNSWDEPLGQMSDETFERLLDQLREMSPVPTVFFGGLGEPLYHPHSLDWITRVKELGGQVELITNGTLLTERVARRLIDIELDLLWVSIDGATPESYADVRLGAELPRVLDNLDRFRRLRAFNPWGAPPKPHIGIAFVAMKRNIAELPEVLAIGRRLRVQRFMVSNLLPYTEEMQEQMIYTNTLRNIAYLSSPSLPKLSLPKMDIDEITQNAFLQVLIGGYNVEFAGNNLGATNDVCTFIESGSMTVRWDGGVCPCPPLSHNHTSYLHGLPRHSRLHVIGNLADASLQELWRNEDYLAYRQRVQSFAFAPCTPCGGCELSEANEEDCFGSEFPTCGGCLWAQGVIQCP